MSLVDDHSKSRFVLLRFAFFFFVGFALLNGALWLAAWQHWSPMGWAYEELAFFAIAAALAVGGAIWAPLGDCWHVIVATLIAGAAHFMLFVLPLILLLGYPYSSYLRRDVMEAMGPALLFYAVALSLTFLVQVARRKRTKG